MALDFAAGCLGGSAGLLFGYPFDTVKVNIQMQCPKRKLYTGTFNCLKQIIAKESMTGLYRGMSSPMAGVAVVNAIVFGVYGNIQKNSTNPNSIKTHFWAGTTAGLVQTIITSPMELAKTRMQIQSTTGGINNGPIFKGPLECVRYIKKTEGIRGLFRGFNITAIRDVPGFASYFVLYELMMRSTTNPGAFHTLMAGGIAGMLSWVISCPIDVVKTRLQADGLTNRYTGILDCIKKSYHAEGLSFLTRGMSSTLMRAFIMNSVCFYVVTYTMKTFDQTTVEVVGLPKLESIIITTTGKTTDDNNTNTNKTNNLPLILPSPNYDKHLNNLHKLVFNKSWNYMGVLSDAVSNNEIFDLANEFYNDDYDYDNEMNAIDNDDDDDLDNGNNNNNYSNQSTENVYYNLNVNSLIDYQSIAKCTEQLMNDTTGGGDGGGNF